MNDLNVVVTGGTKGIGRAIVEHFLELGHHLAFNARNKKEVHDLSKDLSTKYPHQTVIGVPCDMAQKTEIRAFYDQIRSNFEHVDILINNAGLFLPGPMLTEAAESLEAMLAVNVVGAYHLTRLIAPQMIQREKGHIFNMCSIASKKGYDNMGSYCISKYAMLGFTHSLREECLEKKVKVTAVIPGGTWSDSWKGVTLPKDRLLAAKDIALIIANATTLSNSAVVEEIIIQPQLGDV